MRIPTLVLGLVGALLLIFPQAFAAQLGVNYYDESLTDANGEPYIMRSIDQVGQDLDNIKTISNNVKFYFNPYIDKNLPWIEQLLVQAEGRGMHTVVNAFDDHHQMDAGSWDGYADRVVDACARLNGKADEFLVGNEITLHSSMSRTEIRDKVIDLMDRCDAVFDGQVSYEEFWYANDVWRGATDRPIYFMMYENIDSFRNNMDELSSNFGSKGYIGEWGEDLLQDHVEYDEQWQKDQIAQRWQVIKDSPAPVAYIFTYREPSWTSFSMLRPNTDERRPLWEVFGAAGAPVTSPPPTDTVIDVITAPPPEPAPQPEPVEMPQQEIPTQQETPQQETPQTPAPQLPQPTEFVVEQPTQAPPAIVDTQWEMEEWTPPVALNPVLKSNETDGACTNLTYSTSEGDIKLLQCAKPEGDFELYTLEAPRGTYEICVDGGCVSSDNGYDRYGSTGNSIEHLEVTGLGEMTKDEIEESGCRSIEYNDTRALICDHDDHYEMYLEGGNGTICVGEACVGAMNGFVKFE